MIIIYTLILSRPCDFVNCFFANDYHFFFFGQNDKLPGYGLCRLPLSPQKPGQGIVCGVVELTVQGSGKHTKRTDAQVCHPEQAKRVEGSSQRPDICSQIGAKILRLPAVAQDDIPLPCAFGRSC